MSQLPVVPIDRKMRQRIEVFISSPSDVSKERRIVQRVITQLNGLQSIADYFFLKPLAYESDAPAEMGDDAQHVVDRHIRADQCDIFVGILWHRMGTPTVERATGERFQSGTEYEFVKAYRANQAERKPYILLYRSMRAVPQSADPAQWMLVQAFFGRMNGTSPEFRGLHKTYSSYRNFEDMLRQDLEMRLLDWIHTDHSSRQASLAESATDELVSAATRASFENRSWLTAPSNELVSAQHRELLEGNTINAREAVAAFWHRYPPARDIVLDRAMRTQLLVVIWHPSNEHEGPIAKKRNEIIELLEHDRHIVISTSTYFPHENSTVEPVDSPRLRDADLIIVIAEDEPIVVEEVVVFCRQADILHNVYAMIPRRFRFIVSSDLDHLISGYHAVYWYDDYEIDASNLVKETLKCSGARRKVKALREGIT
jgi:hypothetical protein